MFNALLPRQIDNAYRGHKFALWLFGLVLFVKLAISVNSIFNGHNVASSADGIPLDTFTPAGAQTVVALFALLGFAHLIICFLGLVVLVRYRAMVPLMFAVFLLEHLGRKLILQFLPIVRTEGAPGSTITLVLFAVMIVGLALSLWSRDNRPAPG